MTSIEDEARREAERRWPSPKSDFLDGLIIGFVKGAVWRNEQADRAPSDAEVEAAGEAIWVQVGRVPKETVRAALLAAQEVRNRG